MTDARVLVTGASGFVGRSTIDPILARGAAEIHAVRLKPDTTRDPVRLKPDTTRDPVRLKPDTTTGAGVADVASGFSRTVDVESGFSRTNVTLHHIDLHDHAAVDALMRLVRPTHLLHLAWIATPGVYQTSLENPAWVRSSLQLVEAFLAQGGKRVVVAGSAMEYDWSAGVCSERTTPSRPATLYAASKHAVYEVLERWSVQAGFSFAEGRLFWTYGPGEAPERLVPAMIRASITGTPFRLQFPKQVRDYLHVADAGAAFAALLASDVQGAVNIGSGGGVALETLGQIVSDATGNTLVLERGENIDDPAPMVVAETTRLTRDVGWTPRYSLADGIAETVAWWKAHGKMVQA